MTFKAFILLAIAFGVIGGGVLVFAYHKGFQKITLILNWFQAFVGRSVLFISLVLFILGILRIPFNTILSFNYLISLYGVIEFIFKLWLILLVFFIVIKSSIALVSVLSEKILSKELGLYIIDYEKGGRLEKWYKVNYNMKKRSKWLETILKLLISEQNKLINLNTEAFIFVSPTGNKGWYEKDFACLLSKYRKNNKFIISDLAEVNDYTKTHHDNGYEYHYISNRNALDIDKTLYELEIEKVDCIWDIKGLAWYRAYNYSNPFSYNKKRKSIEEIFHVYNNVLKPGGIIIMDAFETNVITRSFNHYMFNCFNRLSGNAEKSTYDVIRKSVKNSETINNLFEEIKLGEGSNSIVVYRKKNDLILDQSA